jgi:hypothetical protein
MYPARCRECHAPLAAQDRTYCNRCAETTQRQTAGKRSAVNGRSPDVSQRHPSTVARQWAKLTQREAERQAWEAAHGQGHDREIFTREIAPQLRTVPVAVLIDATGLSRPMCYRIYNGKSVPHARHWEAIRNAIKQYEATSQTGDAKQLPDAAFAQQIVPHLAEVPTRAIRAATGFSDAFISRIRRGKSAPHRRHWPALLALIEKQRTAR